MYIIVGLGNPGEEYENTRHNVGYMVLDEIQNPKLKAQNNIKFTNFQINKPLEAEIAKGEIEGNKVLLVKPQAFMNNSGIVVKKLIMSYPAKQGQTRTDELRVANDLIIVHDDIGLKFGEVKISHGAGSGKHNGVQSIIDHLGTKEFTRVRCGIGWKQGRILEKYVLEPFPKDEREIADEMIEMAINACILLVLQGLEKTMNKFNN